MCVFSWSSSQNQLSFISLHRQNWPPSEGFVLPDDTMNVSSRLDDDTTLNAELSDRHVAQVESVGSESSIQSVKSQDV